MPIVEMTMIEGYDAQAKQRLVTSLTRAVRSVMAAPSEGVVIVLREVKGGCYARGGQARIPGAPLPSAESVVRNFLDAVTNNDSAAAVALASDQFVAVRRDGKAGDLAGYLASASAETGKRYGEFQEALTDHGSLLIAEGGSGEARFVETFEVVGGRIQCIRQYR